MVASPLHGARLSLLIALPVFLAFAIVAGEMDQLFELTPRVYLMFAGVGILHFILGRSLSYLAIEKIGAARAVVIVVGVNPLVTIPLALLVFDESLSLLVIIGAVLILCGPLLLARGEGASFRLGGREERATFLAGALLAVGTAFFYGVTPVLIKGALNENDVPFLGVLIAYCTAMVFTLVESARPGVMRGFWEMDRTGLYWYLLGGLALTFAQALNFAALNEGDVSAVVLLLQTVPLFVIAMTIAFNRTVEVVNSSVLIGAVVLVTGSALVVSGQ